MKANALLAISMATVLAGASIARAVTVDVTTSSMGNWTFLNTNSAGAIGSGTGTGGMINGPASPPISTGSANLATPSGGGDQSVQLRNANDWVGTKVADLTTLSYYTYATASNATPPAASQDTYLTLFVDTDNNGSYDDRFHFEPTYSAAGAGNGNPTPQADPTLNVWQQWNALTGRWYSDNLAGPGANAVSLATLLASEPNATIVNADNSGLGGIRLTVGFASASDNFNVSVDAFAIGTSAGTTTYNFEPNAVPEPASISLIAGGTLLLLKRRRVQS